MVLSPDAREASRVSAAAASGACVYVIPREVDPAHRWDSHHIFHHPL